MTTKNMLGKMSLDDIIYQLQNIYQLKSPTWHCSEQNQIFFFCIKRECKNPNGAMCSQISCKPCHGSHKSCGIITTLQFIGQKLQKIMNKKKDLVIQMLKKKEDNKGKLNWLKDVDLEQDRFAFLGEEKLSELATQLFVQRLPVLFKASYFKKLHYRTTKIVNNIDTNKNNLFLFSQQISVLMQKNSSKTVPKRTEKTRKPEEQANVEKISSMISIQKEEKGEIEEVEAKGSKLKILTSEDMSIKEQKVHQQSIELKQYTKKEENIISEKDEMDVEAPLKFEACFPSANLSINQKRKQIQASLQQEINNEEKRTLKIKDEKIDKVQTLPFRYLEGSSINLSQKQYQFLLSCLNYPKRIQLLFKASDHDFSGRKFHEICGSHSPTLIMIRNEFGKTIGGYTPLTWEEDKIKWYKVDEKKESFIFSLDMLEKMALLEKDYAIMVTNVDGPIFGQGYDLCIRDKCNLKKSQKSFAKFPWSYGRKKKTKRNDQKEWTRFSGAKLGCDFTVVEYEVFKVFQ